MDGKDRKDFYKSLNAISSKEKATVNRSPQSMCIMRMHLRCTCSKEFFSDKLTTHPDGSEEFTCPHCKKLHIVNWIIETQMKDDDDDDRDGDILASK